MTERRELDLQAERERWARFVAQAVGALNTLGEARALLALAVDYAPPSLARRIRRWMRGVRG